jgi:Restriction endonuclease
VPSTTVSDPHLLILARAGEADGNARGALLESFVANLLATRYGYEQPTTSNLNITADGIEIDVVATHRLTGQRAIVECEAFTRNVAANELTNFYGKLTVARFQSPSTTGLLFALPRLTSNGEEQARTISESDSNFRYIPASALSCEP